ncbi:MAG: hypothetical protein VXZ96_09825 [Myxococcota bacterium]|nr:hypothetical protein [Myxococcota bacterium]
MSIASSDEHVLKLPNQDFSVVIVDRQLYGASGADAVERLRKKGLLLTSECWLCGKERNQNHPDVQEDMKRLSADRYFRKPLSALDVKAALNALTKREVSNISPSTLRMVGQIWASKSSVMLQTDSAKAFFSHGALVHQDPPDGLQQILITDMPKVVYTDVQGEGDWQETGRLLLSLPVEPDHAWIEQHHTKAVRVSAFQQVILHFGVSASLELKHSKNGESRIRDWDKKAQKEVFVLWLMGFVVFEAPKFEALKSNSSNHPLHTRNPVLLLQRLKSEWKRIENAEPWTVLGLSQTASGGLIEDTVDRLRDRYQEIIDTPHLREEILTLAATILEHIVQSANTWQHSTDEGRQPEHIRLLNVAKALFEKGEFYKSEHLLKRASKLVIDNADVHAWYGWAILHNPDRSEESVKEDALDALLVAISADSNNPNALLFLAQYYRRIEQSEQALNPALKLQKLHPSEDNAALIELIKKEIRAQSLQSS